MYQKCTHKHTAQACQGTRTSAFWTIITVPYHTTLYIVYYGPTTVCVYVCVCVCGEKDGVQPYKTVPL